MYKSNMALVINSAARFHCAPDWSWDTGARPMADRDLWTVLAGRGRLWRPDSPEPARYTLGRGDVFVLDGRIRIGASHDPADPLTVVAVHFEGGGPLPFHVRAMPVEFLAGILDRLLRCRLQGDEAAAVRWLAAALDELRMVDAQTAAAGDGTMRDALARLTDQIRERPGDDWRVAEMAGRLNRSPQHLGRLFRSLTGRSPRQYVLDARIEAARAYLRGSSLPLKRIAAELGFHDEFHFSRQFRQRAGRSPAQYRAETPGHL